MKYLTLAELLTEPLYKRLKKEELKKVIDYDLYYQDYSLLIGFMSSEKAENLIRYFQWGEK